MRKIVFIAANEFHPWGGSEVLWGATAESFARRGVQVYASVKDWGSPVKQVEHLRTTGCRIFLRPAPSLIDRASRRLLPRRERAWQHVRKLGTGADLIVISQSKNMDGLPWMEAARSCGVRYAVIAHTAAEAWWPDDEITERLAAAYEGACGAFFVSEANLALSRRQFVTPLSRARVIRNPFNMRYDAKPAWPSGTSAEISLACVGRLDVVQKSQDLLIEALSLPHWRERSVRLLLVGGGVNERGLRRLADSLKLTNVDFAGFVSDIEQVWSKHHALVLPSRHEGMPLVLVEAMLCGRPAIITDVGGARELVRDNVNGFLVKAPTVELLDEAMNRAWENRHRLKEMGEQAAIDVRKFVSPDPVEDFVRELTVLVDSPDGERQ
ncbi:MAG: glycosyltransferase family 4 protein [Candidatus Acidiferrales bacterium]